MLDLNDVRVFTVVARRGTFSAAGRELRLPTSTVARATTRLEKHLEVLIPILPMWRPRPATISALYFGPAALAPKIKVFLDFVGEILGTERDPRVKEAPFEGLFGKPEEV